MEGNSFKYNNFDLIRLIAALQVLIVHYSNYFNLSNYFSEFLMYLPGVPIFFFLSGYLITASWDRLKKEKIITYTTNRCLRIFPALVVCVLIGFLSVLASGYEFNTGSWAAVPLWLLSQITFLQLLGFKFHLQSLFAIPGQLSLITPDPNCGHTQNEEDQNQNQ